MENIILVGFMGSGKTTVGRALAERLNMRFLDTDDMIEKRVGKSISEIFELEGESKFRELEHNLLKELSIDNTILSTGGGVPCFNDNVDLLKRLGKVVYLSVSKKELEKRLIKKHQDRPIIKLNSKNEMDDSIFTLLENRQIYYTKADVEILNEGEIEDVLDNLVNNLTNL